MPPIKLGVIGAGIMGSNHFRAAQKNPNIQLVAVCDNDINRLESLNIGDDIAIVTEPEQLLGLVDAVIIATPTESHYSLAKFFLSKSISCLVEKPISSTVDQAKDLLGIAKDNSTVLMVGHIERFNSAVMALPQFIEKPYHFEFRRISPFSGRVKESIVFDLMIHDLELLCFLNPYPIIDIQAISQNPKSDWSDFSSAMITFSNGSTASLTSSRIGQQKIRSIEISQEESVVLADLLKQDILISRVDHVEYATEGGARFKQHGMIEIPFIDRYGEPLVAEQQEFVALISAETQSNMDPTTAVNALELAHRIEDLCLGKLLDV